ncbi:putative lipase A [Clavispora lusitaniae]|uniref:triacylglycerol lipase n=1 Tax=Clavispora lusitaniae TaxID=36911 RepID=A0AA91PYU3_CLALS|nr:putative lipase A [Clavispora lusitaniae]
MTLVYQWFFDDSVCGYIATTYSNIFEYNDTETLNGERKKTVIVSLRGTRSLHDTLTDLKVEMIPFHNLGSALPWCGENCKIHKGFWAYFYRTMNVIGDLLLSELGDCENYELVLVGHSMGGSVALLLALHFLGLGYSQITLVTMGQPLMGNKDFTTWADYVLGSYLPLSHNTYNRKFIRVIHKGDIVTTIPRVGMRFYEKYHQFDNQIYIDTEASRTNPPPEKVVDCYNGENNECIAGDFQMMDQNYFEIHNTPGVLAHLLATRNFNVELVHLPKFRRYILVCTSSTIAKEIKEFLDKELAGSALVSFSIKDNPSTILSDESWCLQSDPIDYLELPSEDGTRRFLISPPLSPHSEWNDYHKSEEGPNTKSVYSPEELSHLLWDRLGGFDSGHVRKYHMENSEEDEPKEGHGDNEDECFDINDGHDVLFRNIDNNVPAIVVDRVHNQGIQVPLPKTAMPPST